MRCARALRARRSSARLPLLLLLLSSAWCCDAARKASEGILPDLPAQLPAWTQPVSVGPDAASWSATPLARGVRPVSPLDLGVTAFVDPRPLETSADASVDVGAVDGGDSFGARPSRPFRRFSQTRLLNEFGPGNPEDIDRGEAGGIASVEAALAGEDESAGVRRLRPFRRFGVGWAQQSVLSSTTAEGDSSGEVVDATAAADGDDDDESAALGRSRRLSKFSQQRLLDELAPAKVADDGDSDEVGADIGIEAAVADGEESVSDRSSRRFKKFSPNSVLPDTSAQGDDNGGQVSSDASVDATAAASEEAIDSERSRWNQKRLFVDVANVEVAEDGDSGKASSDASVDAAVADEAESLSARRSRLFKYFKPDSLRSSTAAGADDTDEVTADAAVDANAAVDEKIVTLADRAFGKPDAQVDRPGAKVERIVDRMLSKPGERVNLVEGVPGVDPASVQKTGLRGLYTKDFRLEYSIGYDRQGPISPWHDIPLHTGVDTPNEMWMVTLTPRGNSIKYKLLTEERLNPITHPFYETGLRWLKQYRAGAACNYGFLPQTWVDPRQTDLLPKTWADRREPLSNVKLKGDNDPLDVIEVGSQIKWPGQISRVKILGALALIDGDKLDWKVLALDITDPLADQVETFEDFKRLRPREAANVIEWFRWYRMPRGDLNHYGFRAEALPRQYTLLVIEEKHRAWQALRSGDAPQGDLWLRDAPESAD